MTGYDDRRILPAGGGKDKPVVPSYLVRTTLILGDSLVFCEAVHDALRTVVEITDSA